MKLNDWIVATINNPDFTAADFKDILGLSVDNTQLLSEKEYLKSPFIYNNNMFKNSQGDFDKDKFSEFYKLQATKFGTFEADSSLDNYEYGFWDILQTPTSRKRNVKFNLDVVPNSDHISTGVVGPNMLGERTKTASELAQKLKIYDWENKSFKDETPEDYALFANPLKYLQKIFTDPLVLATYDQDVDEIDPFTGQLVHHKKGDKKINSLGEYYYETLSGRSIIGKDVLSLGDIVSKEDSFINKYDFFDSDNILKNTSGVIAKNLMAIAPMAFLGPVGASIYSGIYVVRELSKTLPMLNSTLNILTGGNEDSQFANTMAAWGEQLTGGTSEYSKLSTFNVENFGNLIADVALQWGQQKLIAKKISDLQGGSQRMLKAAETKAALEYEKLAKSVWNRAYNGQIEEDIARAYTNAKGLDDIVNAIKTDAWKLSSIGVAALEKVMPEATKIFSKKNQLGRDLSLAYMSLISNTDVYNDAVLRGFGKKEAAALALGSTLGMFGVDKYLGLGEIMFDETPEKMALRNLRQGIRDEAEALSKQIGIKAENSTLKGLLNIMNRSAKRIGDFVSDYLSNLKNHTLGFTGKAIGEGLEEATEELVTDLTKSLFELAGKFGYVSNVDLGSWDNMLERYGMSFIGGAIGGGLFYGVDAIKNPKSAADLEILKSLLYLVSQGKTKDILENIENLRKEGKFGSQSLSIETTKDSNNNDIYLTADENRQSQNDYIAKVLKDSVLQMDSILTEQGLNISDDKLFELMVLRNHRYMALKESLFDKSYITQYYDDYLNLAGQIYNLETKILEKLSVNDETKRTDNYKKELQELLDQLKELLELKESFFKGEYNRDYVDKMLFYINPSINSLFYESLYEQYVLDKYNKKISELSENENDLYLKEWENLKKSSGKEQLNKAYNVYKNLRDKMEKGLKNLSSEDINTLKRILTLDLNKKNLTYEDKIPSTPIDIDNLLSKLHIVKSSEYDKFWKEDPTKSNKAFLLLLEENPNAYFEIVKDLEDKYWSIHFKTGNEENTESILTDDQKKRLFSAAAAVIPEGEFLSTHRDLTPGGVSGMTNWFGNLDFHQVDVRTVHDREGNEIEIPVWQKDFSGEAEEDYNDRNTIREGESEEDYIKRILLRQQKIEEYNSNHFIEQLSDILDEVPIIDRNTFRTIIASLNIRLLDFLKTLIEELSETLKPINIGILSSESLKNFNQILIKNLSNLKEDFSNSEEIIKQIISDTKYLRKLDFEKKLSSRTLQFVGINFEPSGAVSLDSLIETLFNNNTDEDIENYIESQSETVRNTLNKLWDIYKKLNDESLNEKKLLTYDYKNDPDLSDELKLAYEEYRKMEKNLYYKQLDNNGLPISTLYIFFSQDYNVFDGDVEESDLIPQNSVFEDLLNRLLESVITKIESNKILKIFLKLKHKVSVENNPILKLLKDVLPEFNDSTTNLEEFLESIYLLYNSVETPQDFILDSKLLLTLKNTKKYLTYLSPVIEAASVTSSYNNPLPYNRSLNEFIEENKEVLKDVQKLLEIDPDFGKVLLEHISHFLNEIELWIKRGEQEIINKRELFVKFDLNFNKARLKFFKLILEDCKLNADKNLLKGLEHIDLDKPEAIVEAEKLIYANYVNLNFTILDLITILNTITKSDEVIKQTTGINKQLNEEIEFSDYDKFIYLTSLVASDPIDFYEFYKEKVGKLTNSFGEIIAPLTFLEWNIRLTYILKNAQNLINDILALYATANNIKVPVLKNTVIISGIAGVGKTDVIVRTVSDPESVWVSGPSNTLIDSLKHIIPHAKTLNKTELFGNIIGSNTYSIIQEESKKAISEKVANKLRYEGTYMLVSANSLVPLINFDKIQFNIKDAPKQLIIDEITLFSNAEIQILSKWAEKAGTLLILCGDEHQSGNAEIGFNIQPSSIFTFRTPEMSISLRDANIWKYKNLNNILEILDGVIKSKQYKAGLSKLKTFEFKYYLHGNELTGELITDSLNNEILSSLNGSIAYVGNKNSTVYTTLKNSGKEFVEFDSLSNIQGREFDYVISDLNLDFDKIEKDDNLTESSNLEIYLRDLYTLITRSRKGTVIANNSILNTIKGNIRENYSSNNISLNSDITKLYVDQKLAFINSLDLTRTVRKKEPEKSIKQEESIEVEEEKVNVTPQVVNVEDPEEKALIELPKIKEEISQQAVCPVYTNIDLSGLKLDGEGKLYRPEGTPRDLGIFLGDKHIDPKDRPKIEYNLLKSYIIGGIDLYDRLPEVIKGKFSKKAFEEIEYYARAETPDFTGIHRINTSNIYGLNLNEIAFNPKDRTDISNNKVFTLVAKIKDSSGNINEVTLGLLSDPKTLLENKNKTIQILTERASLLPDGEEKTSLQSYISNYEALVDKYQDLLISLMDENEVKINNPINDKFTRIHKLDKLVPLNDVFDEQMRGRFVISPVYAQVDNEGNNIAFEGIPSTDKNGKNIQGKPIIFVSDFLGYKPEELAEIYANLRAGRNRDWPKVRRIFLSPKGITFQELLFDKNSFKNDDTLVFPFDHISTGLRMYVSMWNFRADLNNYIFAVKAYARDNNIGLDSITEEQIKALNSYLEENKIKRFRFGYDDINGIKSRKIKDVVYNEINWDLACKYQEVINNLFSNVLDKVLTFDTSDQQKLLKDSIDLTEGDFATKYGNNSWVKNLIKNKSITVLLGDNKDSYKLKIQENNIDSLKTLPLILVKLARNIVVHWLAGTSNVNTLEDLNINYELKINDKDLDYASIIKPLLLMQTSKIGKFVKAIPGVVPYNSSKNVGTWDMRFINMFNLIFHGRLTKDAPNMAATGTIFKYGIFIDTFIETEFNRSKPFRAASTAKHLYMTNAYPAGPVLKISLTPWTKPKKSVINPTEQKTEENKELNLINTTLGMSYPDLITAKNNLNLIILTNLKNWFENNDLNKIPVIKYENGKFITLKDQYFPDKEIENINEKNGNVTINFKDGTFITLKYEDDKVLEVINEDNIFKDVSDDQLNVLLKYLPSENKRIINSWKRDKNKIDFNNLRKLIQDVLNNKEEDDYEEIGDKTILEELLTLISDNNKPDCG